jgi:hypothetical protein
MDTKDMYGNDLNNPYTEPEAPRMGRRRPHVPSSKTDNVKEPLNKSGGQQWLPDMATGGLLSVCAGDRSASAGLHRPVRFGERAYMEAF